MRWKWRRARTPSRRSPSHELQDLVKKIALKDKIDESKEFASNVQSALYSGLNAKGGGPRNRGVKKAPFVVLIRRQHAVDPRRESAFVSTRMTNASCKGRTTGRRSPSRSIAASPNMSEASPA